MLKTTFGGKINAFSLSGLIFCTHAVAVILFVVYMLYRGKLSDGGGAGHAAVTGGGFDDVVSGYGSGCLFLSLSCLSCLICSPG